jgi:hypothetical protein
VRVGAAMAYTADGGLVRHDLRNLRETSCHRSRPPGVRYTADLS